MSEVDPQQVKEALCRLSSAAASLGLTLSGPQLAQIQSFWQALFDYNQHTNLVARPDVSTVMAEHVLDSLTLVAPIQARIKAHSFAVSPVYKLVDIGSGAGFPGLVLAIVVPNLEVTLVEPISKKARFLTSVAETVDGLVSRIEVVVDRAEDLARKSGRRDSFDFATARAVGPLPLIAELSLPFLKVGGCLLAQKTVRQLDEEFKRHNKIERLGGSYGETLLPDSQILGKEHAIIVIEKARPTPAAYPRTWSKIKQDNQS